MISQARNTLLASGDMSSVSVESDSYVDSGERASFLANRINLNQTAPFFRIYVLYPDETINYEIEPDYIKTGGSYSENYQNGQRRSLNFTLSNEKKEFTPNINRLWTGTKLRFDVGIIAGEEAFWFEKGIFVITKASPNSTATEKTVSVSAADKFCLFDGAMGKLVDTYEIQEGLEIREVISSILMSEMGNGNIRDPQKIIYHEKFEGKKVMVSITKNAGDTFSDILLELASQLSAEIFYNSLGNLVLVPITDVTQDKNKPIIYFLDEGRGDISQLNLDFDFNSIINRVVVLGNSQNGGVYRAIAVNADERSSLCYQRIGYRTGDIISDNNITSDILARERAEYELRQKLILKTSVSATVPLNPFLVVNNLVAIHSETQDLNNEKFLLQSISFNIDFEGQMNISLSNIQNISTSIEVKNGF